MKNIKFNLITDINTNLLDSSYSVITENTDFPVVNALDIKPKKVARSTAQAKYKAGFSFEPDIGFDSFALFNTNGYYVVASVLLRSDRSLLWGPVGYDLSGITTLEQFMVGKGDEEPQKSLLEEFCLTDRKDGKLTTMFLDDAVIEFMITTPTPLDGQGIEIDDPTKYVYCGIIWTGAKEVYPNPDMGLSKGYVDKSIVDEYNSGSVYIIPRQGWRTFSGSILVNDSSGRLAFDTYMAQVGPMPVPWKIVDNYGTGWNVFARAAEMPSMAFDYYGRANLSFTLTEVL